jgi:hypothetical protein
MFAVRVARLRGAPAMVASVFDPLPRSGRWGTVLLLDGNLGIGGDPAALLARVRTLLRPGGRVLAELDRPGVRSHAVGLRLVVGERATGPVPWAVVGVDSLPEMAERAGLCLTSLWTAADRWFARLDRP